MRGVLGAVFFGFIGLSLMMGKLSSKGSWGFFEWKALSPVKKALLDIGEVNVALFMILLAVVSVISAVSTGSRSRGA